MAYLLLTSFKASSTTVAASKMTSRKKLTVSISTWFCLPEQGMKDMEILSRATAFIVKSSSSSYKNRLHVLTASHNVAPWKFPKMYPEEWLQFIDEKNTHYTIEVRHPDGIFMTQSELLPVSYHHSSRDLAVLHLEKDADGVSLFDHLGCDYFGLSIDQPEQGDSLLFEGHSIVAANGTSSSSNFDRGDEEVPTDGTGNAQQDVRLPVPTIIPGTFVSQNMFQQYAQSVHQINHGMSGGPVTFKKSGGAESRGNVKGTSRIRTAVSVPGTISTSTAAAVSSSNGDVCGLLESVVPQDSKDVALRGMVCYVDSLTIKE